MKKGVYIALFAVVTSLLSPFSVAVSPAAEGPALITLDTCHAGYPLSVNVDSPCILEHISALQVVEAVSSIDGVPSSFWQFVTAFRKDRPPKI